jgi:hypothetical protein
VHACTRVPQCARSAQVLMLRLHQVRACIRRARARARALGEESALLIVCLTTVLHSTILFCHSMV